MKHSVLFRLFNVLLSAIVLTTSTGFGLVEHACIVKGKTYTLVSQEKKCSHCKEHTKKTQQQPVVEKKSCCDEKTTYENVDYPSSSSLTQLGAKVVKAITDAVVQGVTWLAQRFAEIFTSTFSTSALPQKTFTLSGRSILHLVQSYLI